MGWGKPRLTNLLPTWDYCPPQPCTPILMFTLLTFGSSVWWKSHSKSLKKKKKKIALCSRVHCIRPSSVLSAGNWVCLPVSPQPLHFKGSTSALVVPISFYFYVVGGWFSASSHCLRSKIESIFTLSCVLQKDNDAFHCLQSRILKGSIFDGEIAKTNK